MEAATCSIHGVPTVLRSALRSGPEPGTVIGGRFVVERRLGEGGVGVVFVATERELRRQVAVKLLSPGLTEERDAIRRFYREAHALSRLHHPSIVALYDFGVDTALGRPYLVTELVEGETLGSVLANEGALEPRRAAALLAQVAAALTEAHGEGIVHRDLSLDNVLVQRLPGESERAVVVDFGIASVRGGNDDGSLTETGAVLGSPGTMSPEQLAGGTSTSKSDLYSLGCLLVALCTGRLPGGRAAWPPDRLADGAPPSKELRELVAELLATAPDERPDGAKEVCQRLSAIARDGYCTRPPNEATGLPLSTPDAETGAADSTRPARATRLPVVVAVVVVAVAIAVGVLLRGSSRESPSTGSSASRGTPPMTMPGVNNPPSATREWATPRILRLSEDEGHHLYPAFSPDGALLAYTDTRDIFVRDSTGSVRNLTRGRAPGASEPTFSPDGRHVAGASDEGLVLLSVSEDTPPRRLGPMGYSPSFTPDGSHLVFSTQRVDDIFTRIEDDGELRSLDLDTSAVTPIATDGPAIQPRCSPRGHRIVFFRDTGIYTVPLEGGPARMLKLGPGWDTAVEWMPSWSPDGTSVYFLADHNYTSTVYRLPVDEVTGETLGSPTPVLRGGLGEAWHLAVAPDDGHLAVTEMVFDPSLLRFALAPDSGTATPDGAVIEGLRVGYPDIAPDGRQAVFATTGLAENIVRVDLETGTLTPVVSEREYARGPRWAPDGEHIVFWGAVGERRDGIWSVRPDGTELKRLGPPKVAPTELFLPVFSPDGNYLAVTDVGLRAFVIDLGAPWGPQLADAHALPETGWLTSAWSPDGTHLATLGGGAGRAGVGQRDILTGRHAAISDCCFYPLWLPDGRRLLASELNGSRIFLLEPEVGTEVPVIDVSPRTIPVHAPLALSRDGRVLLVATEHRHSRIWGIENTEVDPP